MIPLTIDCEKWLQYRYGNHQLKIMPNVVPNKEAVQLNKDSDDILSALGNREFDAAVGFLDLNDFSKLSKDKSPKEICNLVEPFISIVIDIAKENSCFIDKTIGDEIMVVLPWFDPYATLNDDSLNIKNTDSSSLTGSLYKFLSSLISRLAREKNVLNFSAGFTFGSIYLGKIGTDEFYEWTCYGNSINTAKRLEQETSNFRKESKSYTINIGAQISEYPNIESELNGLISIDNREQRIFYSPSIVNNKRLRGVGEVTYLVSG